ncbi:hypothetical protein [Burkholderia stabilis]|uniref:hypothetical protein n=1 Tax=Burkholderia stabilis TaxID=95485 RepID=UPI0015885D82|nr:hypothetical protein [Burkholderia stabilis]
MDIAVTAYADPDASPASLAHDRAAAASFLGRFKIARGGVLPSWRAHEKGCSNLTARNGMLVRRYPTRLAAGQSEHEKKQ